MAKVDILQLVITNAAIIGVGLTWLNFTKKKTYETVCYLIDKHFIDDVDVAKQHHEDSDEDYELIYKKLCATYIYKIYYHG